MRIFKREMWSYVVLLLILFALASVSVSQVLVFLHDLLIEPQKQFPTVAGLILLITMGFMFLAGAFGLWTIQFVTEKEAQRRLAQLVDAMDHLQDGMMVVDKSGRISAMNAGARKLLSCKDETTMFNAVLPGLDHAAIQRILGCQETVETEESVSLGTLPPRTLRFRSQPVDTFHVVMLSDVTAINLQRQYSLVKARLQLLGELARGVAHDFSSLLIDISGYAALLARVPRTAPEFDEAVRAIVRGAERGTSLAEQILAMARQTVAGSSTDLVTEHVRAATDDLAAILPPEWRVSFSGEGKIPVVALSGIQIEQIVINLSLLVSENRRHPGTVSVIVAATAPGTHGAYAGSILIHGAASIHDVMDSTSGTHGAPSGVILSVIRSIVEDAGGRLDAAIAAEGTPYFRVWLPHGRTAAKSLLATSLPAELARQIAEWRVLLACTSKPELHQRLTQTGTAVQTVSDVVSALSVLEQDKGLDGIIIDQHFLKTESRGLLRAIRKLRPGCGIVVLAESESTEMDLPEGVMFAQRQLPPDAILRQLFQARQAAMGVPTPENPPSSVR